MLKQNISKKNPINKNNLTKLNTNNNNSVEYKVEIIWNNTVYEKKLKPD